MTLIACKACKTNVSAEATACPNCGQPTQQAKAGTTLQVIVAVVLLVSGAWYFFGGGMEQQTQKTMTDIHNQVTDEVVQQYNIAKRQGDKIQICIQAGIVSAAYLQAKNEAAYQQWKMTEAADCKKAGMPR